MKKPMDNLAIADIFDDIADYLAMQDVQFKPRAYHLAAQLIRGYPEEMREVYERGGVKALEDLPDIGTHIALKIVELVKTGKLRYYERLKKALPVNLRELTAIEGIGPKTVYELYKKLWIRNLADLEKAAKAGKISKIKGFSKKSEANILRGLEFYRKSRGRLLLGVARPLAEAMINRLKKATGIKTIEAAGSLRRSQETIGDIDILAITDKPTKAMEAFCRLPEVAAVLSRGDTRSSVRLRQGLDADLRVVPAKSFGSALQYFTGDKAHNIIVRTIAKKKGLKLNEYGVFRGRKQIAGQTEREVYTAIGLPYFEPEIRTASGEIEAAKAGQLPKLIELKDIRGDLHLHTTWTDGAETLEVMARAAEARGYDYIAFTDHTQYLKIAGGMDEKRLRQYIKAVHSLRPKFPKLEILAGAEVNILADGKLDIDDKTLAELDIVIAGVHSHFNLSKGAMTKRLLKAINHPEVNVIVHPTGRLIGERPAYELDFEKIFKAAKKAGVALEINAYYTRLDLRDELARQAAAASAMLAIDTDAHHSSHLSMMEFGVAQARRGWIGPAQVINTWPLAKLKKFLAKK